MTCTSRLVVGRSFIRARQTSYPWRPAEPKRRLPAGLVQGPATCFKHPRRANRPLNALRAPLARRSHWTACGSSWPQIAPPAGAGRAEAAGFGKEARQRRAVAVATPCMPFGLPFKSLRGREITKPGHALPLTTPLNIVLPTAASPQWVPGAASAHAQPQFGWPRTLHCMCRQAGILQSPRVS